MDTKDRAKVPDYPEPHKKTPTQVKGEDNSVLRIWVCQASYGDTLALEIDPTPPKGAFGQDYNKAVIESKSRSVILIDGGPANISPTGQTFNVQPPINDLYNMLQELLPYYSNKMDTLVVTHDDEDHILGIADLLHRLLGDEDTTNAWPRGSLSVKEKRSPFANVWHNSANTIVSLYGLGPPENKSKKASKNEVKQKNIKRVSGYFDSALKQLRGELGTTGKVPYFNAEFLPQDYSNFKGTVREGFETYRGHAHFEFLGPSFTELRGLSNFFKKNQNTQASPRQLTKEEMMVGLKSGNVKGFGSSAVMLTQTKNDTSRKNLASIVFLVSADICGETWRGLFTGDASACNIFKDIWKGEPIHYDLIKIGHHGSAHNNFFGTQMLKDVKRKITYDHTKDAKTIGEVDHDRSFFPDDASLAQIMPDVKQTKGKEYLSMSNVLGYFCNVRAKRYIISASHDKHPNPHVSTLIALATRAMLYPEPDGPIRIFLTNPISSLSWQQFFEYWLKIDPKEVNKPDHSKKSNSSGPIAFNDPEMETRLKAICTQVPEDNNSLDNLGYKVIKELTKLSYDYESRFYQFYCLRITDSFGPITAGPGNPLDIREANWMLIEPHDACNVIYMIMRYDQTLVGRLGNPKSVDAMTTKFSRKGSLNDSDAGNLGKRPFGKSQFTSSDIYMVKKRKKNGLFHNRIQNPHGQPDEGNEHLVGDINFHKINNGANNFMMAQMPSGPQWNPVGRAPLTSFTMQQKMQNKVSKLDLSSESIVQKLKAPTTSREDARRPNRDAFRRFDVDEFEIPMGDDFFGMTEIPIKHIATFQDLLIYLVKNNSLKLSEAIDASTHACLEGDPRLGAILHLLLGGEEAEKVLRTLPLSFASDISVLDDENRNPLLWPVQFMDAAVVDIDAQGQALQDASGIQQFTIRIYPTLNDTAYTWRVPNRAALMGKGRFDIHILEYIELTIYWPTDTKRLTVHGSFAGSLPTRSNEPEQPIICEWLKLPSENRPIVYHIQFANSDYETDNYSMNILDMIAIFDGVSVDLALAAVDALLPGLVNTTNPLGEHLLLKEPGFTLSLDHIHTRDLRLHGVFGTFSFVDVPDWKPFGGYDGKPGLEGFLSTIQIPAPSLRLCMQEFFSETGARFFFRLSHSIKWGATQLQYEFESRPLSSHSRLYEFTFRPVNDATKEPLSVMGLLSSFELVALSQEDVPDALWSALKSISLTCFRFGWRNEMGLRFPDFLEVAIRIKGLEITEGLLELDDVFLRIRIDNPGNKALRNIYIRSGGAYQLAGVKHLITLTYGNNPFLAQSVRGSGNTSTVGPMDLAIRCTDTPLTLGKILDHFWPGTDLIPAPFNVVTESVGLSRFQITTGYDEIKNKQELQVMSIGLGVAQHDIEIIEGLSLINPEMLITVYFPFDQSLRTFVINFSAIVTIEDYSLLINVGLKTGEAGQFWVTLRAGGEGFPVGAFLKFASQKIGKALNIDYPERFGPLDSTYIDEFSILVGKDDGGKLSILGFSIDVYSNLSLSLWDSPGLSVENVALNANYQANSGFNVDFGAELKVNEHLIRVSVGYQELRTNNQVDTSNVASKDKGWFVEANYPDDIDLLALVSRLTGLEISSSVSQTELPKMSTPSGGVTLKDLNIRLQKDKVGGALYISADTTWKPFKHLEFAATYEGTTGWGFCLAMSLEDELLSLIPIDFIKEIGEYVDFNKTIVALYVNNVNNQKAGLNRKDLPPAPGSGPVPSTSGFGLAVSTQVRLTDKCGLIREWLRKGELDIVGDISAQGVSLGVKIGRVELLKNKATGKYDLEIDGRFDLRANHKGLQVGLIADMRINCPKVTTDVILVEQAGFIVQLADAGIGFQGAVKGTLRNLFEIEGLEARGLSVIGVFSLAESGVPEELGFTGELGLKDMDGIKGRLAFYYAQRDITKCYFSGKLEKVDMEAIINLFLKKQGLPDIAGQFLQGNFVINTLELEAALSDMYVKQLKLNVEQGFFYEASLYARAGSFEWSGYTRIEARPGAFQFVAMMSPLQFAANSQTFFSLTRDALSAAEYEIPKPKGKVDENMLKNGPVIYISTKDRARPLFMTARLQLVGFVTNLSAVGDQNGFLISFQTSLDMDQLGLEGDSASLAANGRVVPNQRAAFTLTISANIGLAIPRITLSGFNENVSLPGKFLPSVGFSVDFSFEIGWPNTGTGFNLNLTAKINALGQSFDVVSLAVNLSPEDLDTLAKVASAAVEGFKNEFGNLLKDSMLGQSIDQVGRFLKDRFDMAHRDLVTAISILSNSRPQDVIERLGRTILNLTSFNEVIGLVSTYGVSATTATKIALKLFRVPVFSPVPGLIDVPIGGPVRIPIGSPIGIPTTQPIDIPTGPIHVRALPTRIIGGLLGLFGESSEMIPLSPMAFDNRGALDVEKVAQKLGTSVETLKAVLEKFEKAPEARKLAVAASLTAGVGQSATTGAMQALLAGASTGQVSSIKVTAGVSEELQTTSAESTETSGPLQPESSQAGTSQSELIQAETSQTEPIQADSLQPQTQDLTDTVLMDPSMLPTTTADGTQIVWVSENQLAQLIEQQRIALLNAALNVYPVEEVYEASKANFDDTTPERIQMYLAAAGVAEDVIKKLVEPAAGEQPA